MDEILLSEYWSKADAFLLPLTGLYQRIGYGMSSYLFWNNYSIEDYKLTLAFDHEESYGEFIVYMRNHVFPILDKKGYLVESYDIGQRSVFILDLSEWAMDIESFLAGKYSPFTKEAKVVIEKFHLNGGNVLPRHIFAALYPNTKIPSINSRTAIEYMADLMGMEPGDFTEIGSIYDKVSETLLTDVDQFCQIDTNTSKA